MKQVLLFLLFLPVFAYGQKTDSALLKGANTIKNEINPKANTQIRVGGQLVDMVNGKLARIEKDTVSGTDTYTVSLAWVQSYKKGLTLILTFVNENTGASTININGYGAKPLVKNGVFPLTGGEIEEGETCILHYDGTNFQVVAGADGGSSGSISAVSPLFYDSVTGNLTFPSWPSTATGLLANNGSDSLYWAALSSTIPSGVTSPSDPVNTYSVSLPGITDPTGLIAIISFDFSNTGPSTLQVGSTTLNLLKNHNPLKLGDIRGGQSYWVVWSAYGFELIGGETIDQALSTIYGKTRRYNVKAMAISSTGGSYSSFY